jgi:hypothetical protein
MKLTTARLKKLIREELSRMKEAKYATGTPLSPEEEVAMHKEKDSLLSKPFGPYLSGTSAITPEYTIKVDEWPDPELYDVDGDREYDYEKLIKYAYIQVQMDNRIKKPKFGVDVDLDEVIDKLVNEMKVAEDEKEALEFIDTYADKRTDPGDTIDASYYNPLANDGSGTIVLF